MRPVHLGRGCGGHWSAIPWWNLGDSANSIILPFGLVYDITLEP